ncbi:GNAT family N-acetyltransferase [Pseudomonas sp. NPDC079086]|uniref:GNAT family N-acetyltransferase n=1 Tax=unclassified Pseudomonas TaxID=196821 RepID=UPI0037CA250E
MTTVTDCVIVREGDTVATGWDDFVESSNDGTLFHQMRFLRYHGNRFSDSEHFLSIQRKQKRIGVWPLALVERDGELCALSPYGASYGGPALREALGLSACRDVIGAAVAYVASAGAKEFRVTLPLRACSRVYTETFRFALMEAGFACVNRDVSSVIPLDPNLTEFAQVESHRSEWERRARKASKSGVVVRRGAPIEHFWQVLDVTFAKHGMKPTHTFEELQWLVSELPESIFFSCAYLDEKPVAGVCYFVQNRRVVGTFYLCQDPQYQATQAQSALLLDGFQHAQEMGYIWMDLGTSSVQMKAYDSIFRFKETLGAVGQFRETYVLELE